MTAGRRVAVIACLVLALAMFGTAAFAISRLPTPAERLAKAQAAAKARHDAALHALWHNQPVDQLFPARLSLSDTSGFNGRELTRMGVAPVSDCASALDPGLQAALAAFGCTQVLRATYVDATQTRAATVAIVVLSVDPDSPAKRTLDVQNENKGRFDSQQAMTVRVPVFPGTAAAGFTNTARVAWHLSVSLALPYEVVTAAGFTDGRTGNFGPGSKDGTDSGIQSLARTVGDRIENGLWQLAMEIP